MRRYERRPTSRRHRQPKTHGPATYAARTVAALREVDGGTAKDVNAVADVPRTSVSDVVSELPEDLAMVSAWDRSFEPVVRLLVVDRMTTPASGRPRERFGGTKTGVRPFGDENEPVLIRSFGLSALGPSRDAEPS